MRLVLYSGGDTDENVEIDSELINIIGTTKPKITYIPADSHGVIKNFEQFKKHFSFYGFSNFNILNLDSDYTEDDINKAFNSDLIYLSGGNTYYFLHSIQVAKLQKKLRIYATNGGVLAGESAGSIIMTPCINTAGMPSFDRDPNDVRLKNLASLDLVNFEFFPHYEHSYRYKSEFINYTKKSKLPLLACSDGSGIIVVDDKISLIGNVFCYFHGHKFNFFQSY